MINLGRRQFRSSAFGKKYNIDKHVDTPNIYTCDQHVSVIEECDLEECFDLNAMAQNDFGSV